MKHRIFIAINLPDNIKNKFSKYENKWFDLPCRWTRPENFHITLAFLGFLTDEEILKVCDITKEIAKNKESFLIKLDQITYGPNNSMPRMIWAIGPKNKELGKLQTELANALGGLTSELKEERQMGFAPHITLGRLKEWEFRAIEPEERPNIQEEINFDFEVESIEVMQSDLKKEGPDYSILETIPLGEPLKI